MSRILAIDYGEKRVGLALSDPLQIIAKPLQVLDNSGKRKLVDEIRQIIDREKVVLVVLGLPLGMEGQETKKTLEVKRFGSFLTQELDTPLTYWDERLTTSEANDELKRMGYHYLKARQFVDAVAASMILRSYLENRG